MSTSMLNHTFGISGVQYISVNFLVARPLLTAACTATISSARTANLVMLLSSAKLQELSKCCQAIGVVEAVYPELVQTPDQYRQT